MILQFLLGDLFFFHGHLESFLYLQHCKISDILASLWVNFAILFLGTQFFSLLHFLCSSLFLLFLKILLLLGAFLKYIFQLLYRIWYFCYVIFNVQELFLFSQCCSLLKCTLLLFQVQRLCCLQLLQFLKSFLLFLVFLFFYFFFCYYAFFFCQKFSSDVSPAKLTACTVDQNVPSEWAIIPQRRNPEDPNRACSVPFSQMNQLDKFLFFSWGRSELEGQRMGE